MRVLQGNSKSLRLDPKQVSRVEEWIGRIRKAHPEVAKIHARMAHPLGGAILFFDAASRRKLAKATWKQGRDRLPTLKGSSGMKDLDELLKELEASLERFDLGKQEPLWMASFPRDYDVNLVCKRFRALEGVTEASSDLVDGDGDEIMLKLRGHKLLFVFKHGWGDCPSGCIYNHYFYFEADTTTGKFEKRGELDPKAARNGAIHLWGVPARFAIAPFKDFDAVLQASTHKDWWVRQHALAVIGMMLAGAQSPWLGEDRKHRKTFDRIRDGVRAHPSLARRVLIDALETPDPDVRKTALLYLRRISKLRHGSDVQGIKAWRAWLEAEKLDK